MNLSKKHISVHIEKTAGTSLERFFAEFYGSENVLIYSNDTDKLIRADRLVARARVNTLIDKFRSLSGEAKITPYAHWLIIQVLRRRAYLENTKNDALPSQWSVIHGHFQADKFDLQIQNPFRTIVFREPLERTISHFMYWRKAKGVVNHRLHIPYDPNLSFSDFAFSDALQNFQTKALGTIPLDEFDVVGVAENLGDFISRIIDKRKGCRGGVKFETPFLNRSLSQPDLSFLGVNEDFKRKFMSSNDLDYCNYMKIRNLCGLVPLDTH